MTAFILTFGAALLLAVLVSGVASRSPLSTTAVFLAVGVVAGPLALDVIDAESTAVEIAAEIALFAILFTDGQHSPASVLRRNWRTPTRALLICMPLTFALVTLLAHTLVGLDWVPAMVLGAVLAPTDPVFASALVGRDDVPHQLRQTLNIESGLNDGLALPAVLIIAGTIGADPKNFSTAPWVLLGEVLTGVLLGVALPLLVTALLRLPGVRSETRLLPLVPLAVAILLYELCAIVHANQFLAAFVAGSVMATMRPKITEHFGPTGELVTELVKGGAVLFFATLLDPGTLGDIGALGWLLALTVILAVRPLSLLVSMWRSRLPRNQRLSAAWFGPKGFASVAYAVIIVNSGMPEAKAVFSLAAATVLVSIVLHSSTDVAVARRLSSGPPDTLEARTRQGPGHPQRGDRRPR